MPATPPPHPDHAHRLLVSHVCTYFPRTPTAGAIEKGFLAALLVCSVSTLLLFGCSCHPSDEEGSFDLGAEGTSYYSDSSEDNSSSRSLFGAFSACASMSRSGSLGRPLPGLWYTYALLGGLSGALGEALPLGVDDNLSLPLVSGGIFQALSRYIAVEGQWMGLQGGVQQ